MGSSSGRTARVGIRLRPNTKWLLKLYAQEGGISEAAAVEKLLRPQLYQWAKGRGMSDDALLDEAGQP